MAKADTKGAGSTKSKTAEEHDAARRAVKARQKSNRSGSTKKSSARAPFTVGHRRNEMNEAQALKARERHAFVALEMDEYRSLKSDSTAEIVARKIIATFPYVELAPGEKRTNAAVNDSLAQLGFNPSSRAVRLGESRARQALRKAFYSL